MINEKEPVRRIGSRLLLLPFLLIVISAIMALVELVIYLGSYFGFYQSFYSSIEYMLIFACGVLSTPLFVVGVALLLMFLTRARKGMATRSRLLFLSGAVLILAGSLFSMVQSMHYFSGNFNETDFDLWNMIGIIGMVASILGTSVCAISTVLLVRSYLRGEISGDPAFRKLVRSDQGGWADTAKKPVFTLLVVLVAVIIVVASISLIVSFHFWEKQAVLPVHAGDFIVWSVNGTRNGQNVSGSSTWTFHDVGSITNQPFFDISYAYKYDISIRTELNGIATDYETAGAFNDSRLWSLGINPTVLSEGHSGYYNGGDQIFQSYETISTASGLKSAALYIELYNNNSNEMWSKMWIDVDTGMPYKIQMTEPATFNGYPNEFSGTLIFQMLSTNISQ
jgi:hypothetical protein